ncbi:MAG: hypothetical protein CO088_04525 [Candidatus Yonathbacteria bacterium CG_4_9_14_0_8_um_filter_46_47]|uniref:Uncharacterized protein n=2 Tax=Parcubacteria group TaxID=1794811 RepID=A0A2M8D5F3_9BACT|nr:MAG: hypothetical protein AUJ44_03260 [Candidatus Nomurabacteria bacterium CG1_02_47_685]PIP03753.1 MAG: hypothetical protein COX54_02555 [Candidatus Yonathbacteria bacterium CG23_combo_of_CG06-09_8_20_14_all_46_18]PIY57313.1 MAG: hypothetical protein COY99_03855 [Candidatus Yonathbacteria bacterium CG_4_10_14_0_8_um_filter_47_645]PJB81728.1 MAG: hypothetical protein CO088_04525 [Candidatus Yonathbacteria bacterium CG_4_9_14_0_8_um_filter_46_47]PJC21223.1 MAG: hypothetical protein CO061_0006
MPRNAKLLILGGVVAIIAIIVAVLFLYAKNGGNVGPFAPFGMGTTTNSHLPPDENDDGNGGILPGNIVDLKDKRLIKIHAAPVSGFSILEKANVLGGKDIIARYIERGRGYIFETNMSDVVEQTVSSQEHRKIYEAEWGNNGMQAIARYLNDDTGTIRSFVIKLGDGDVSDGTTTPTLKEVDGEFLPENITNLAVSNEDTNKVFFLTNIADDYEGSHIPKSAVGTIHNITTGNESAVFTSPFTQWLSYWPQKNIIALTTKPSGGVPGYLYFLNPTTGKLTKEIGDVKGLTTLVGPNGRTTIYSESASGKFETKLYDTGEHTFENFPINTLPEKCAWSTADSNVIYCANPQEIPQGMYPDAWYQGVVSFSDDIWMFDLSTGETRKIIDFKQESGGEELDGIKLATDPDGVFLFFINKKDLSLWALRLKASSVIEKPKD